MSDSELARAARPVLDSHYASEVVAAKALFHTRLGQKRATSDIGEAARAATLGAIELLLVDIDQVLPGVVDDTDGKVSLVSTPGTGSYDVIDEIAGRAILTGAKFLGVREADLPGGTPLAAILRYPL
jgi:hypothetical protein